MKSRISTRLLLSIAMSAVLVATSLASDAQPGSDVSSQHQAGAQQQQQERIQQQVRLENDRYDYDNDPFYYTPPTYRYRRGENYYETNEFGADMLRQASNIGYQQGVRAGRADQQDNWRFDYRESFAVVHLVQKRTTRRHRPTALGVALIPA